MQTSSVGVPRDNVMAGFLPVCIIQLKTDFVLQQEI